jgi:2Fe-2S ferredoxin
MVDVEVRFSPSDRLVRVPKGTRLLDAAKRAGLPIASGCDAHGLCARCGVVILDGQDAVSAETPGEATAKRLNRIDPQQRLACMATVSDDIRVTATYW